MLISATWKSAATEMQEFCVELQATDPMELTFLTNVTSSGRNINLLEGWKDTCKS